MNHVQIRPAPMSALRSRAACSWVSNAAAWLVSTAQAQWSPVNLNLWQGRITAQLFY